VLLLSYLGREMELAAILDGMSTITVAGDGLVAPCRRSKDRRRAIVLPGSL